MSARLIRTPKVLLLVVLVVLTAATAPGAAGGAGRAWLSVAVAAGTAAAAEITVMAVTRRRPRFPDGAVGTGAILGMILDPELSLLISAAVAAGAIAVKHALRIRRRNVLNPAAAGLVILGVAGIKAQSWWGVAAAPGYLIIPLIVIGGAVVSDRVNRLPTTGTFLCCYYTVLAAAALAGLGPQVAEAYRPPFVNTALFAAFVMLTDPPTSPGRRHGQYAYAVTCAVVSAVFIIAAHQLYFLPLGILVGNLAWAWTRRNATARSRGLNQSHILREKT